MRLNHLKTRIWLALAVAIASLGLVSSASAMPVSDSGPVVKAPPTAVPSSGFDWNYALLAAGVVLALAVAALAVAHVSRHRARLAT